MGQTSTIRDEHIHVELWSSLASLLRSYTAAHSLGAGSQAIIEQTEEKITVRHRENWLILDRQGAQITWTRENGSGGRMKISDAGRLRSETHEEELDLAAEAWARELMR